MDILKGTATVMSLMTLIFAGILIGCAIFIPVETRKGKEAIAVYQLQSDSLRVVIEKKDKEIEEVQKMARYFLEQMSFLQSEINELKSKGFDHEN